MKDFAIKSHTFYRKLPLLLSLLTVFIWGGSYLLSAKLHGMPKMFNSMFPMIIGRFMGAGQAVTTTLAAALLVMLDAAVLGAAIGLMLQFYFRRRGRRIENNANSGS